MVLTERRCEPGAKVLDRSCERHSNHYWCPWCEGFYGVPHMDEFGSGGCHSQPESHGGRPDAWQCACRYCRILRDRGWRAADAFRDAQAERAKAGRLLLDAPGEPARLGPTTGKRVAVEFADTAWEALVMALREAGTTETIGFADRIDAQLQQERRSDTVSLPVPPPARRRRIRRARP